MAFRELEVEVAGTIYEIESHLSVREGELLSVEIEGVREIREQGDPTEIKLMTPTFRALLETEVRRHFDDPEYLQELEQDDRDAARDAAVDAALEAAREDRGDA